MANEKQSDQIQSTDSTNSGKAGIVRKLFIRQATKKKSKTIPEKMVERTLEIIEQRKGNLITIHVGEINYYKPISNQFNILICNDGLSDRRITDIPKIRQADVIIVPSLFCKNTLEITADQPVHVASDFYKTANRLNLTKNFSKKNRFVVIVENDLYECWLSLFRVWQTNFIDNPDLQLTVCNIDQGAVTKSIQGNVRCRTGPLSHSEMINLFDNNDICIDLPSSRDGYGFYARQAMSRGLRVIVPHWGGYIELDKDEMIYSYDCSLARRQIMSSSPSIANDGLYGTPVIKNDSLLECIYRVLRQHRKRIVSKKKMNKDSEIIEVSQKNTISHIINYYQDLIK